MLFEILVGMFGVGAFMLVFCVIVYLRVTKGKRN